MTLPEVNDGKIFKTSFDVPDADSERRFRMFNYKSGRKESNTR
jgi:hypothetical protein